MPYTVIVTPEALQNLDKITIDYWLDKMGNPTVAGIIRHEFWQAIPKIEENPFAFGQPWANLPMLAEEGYRRALFSDYHTAILFRVDEDSKTVSVEYVYDTKQKRTSGRGKLIK